MPFGFSALRSSYGLESSGITKTFKMYLNSCVGRLSGADVRLSHNTHLSCTSPTHSTLGTCQQAAPPPAQEQAPLELPLPRPPVWSSLGTC